MSGPGQQPGGSLKVRAELANLPRLTGLAAQAARRAGWDQAQGLELEMVVEEIASNVIKYAYADQPGDITLSWRMDSQGGLVLEVWDQGRSFNPLQAPAPDVAAPLADRPPGGLGIFLARKLMDRVTYRREGASNVLELARARRA